MATLHPINIGSDVIFAKKTGFYGRGEPDLKVGVVTNIIKDGEKNLYEISHFGNTKQILKIKLRSTNFLVVDNLPIEFTELKNRLNMLKK